MKHSILNESAALSKYVSLLTSQSTRVNFVQPGLILSKLHTFLGASLDSTITNVDNFETWKVEIIVPHQNMIQEKANRKIQWKRSHK